MQDEVGGEGSRDGRYALCEPIAPGPSATVFFGRERRSEGLSSLVVIERHRPEVPVDPEQAARVCHDARQAVRIRHGNVVAIQV